jgi:hypothetical protein
MSRLSELTLTDGDGVKVTLCASSAGLSVMVTNWDGHESNEVCLVPGQHRQVATFLREALRDPRCTAGGDCPVHPNIQGIHNPELTAPDGEVR